MDVYLRAAVVCIGGVKDISVDLYNVIFNCDFSQGSIVPVMVYDIIVIH